ncbi:MAG: DUF998 domain-containing protein [Candidatus Kariarchaeaceae archaeon]|jgi:hypothetical protein
MTHAALISPKALQRTLGILGFVLPLVLYFGNLIVFGDSELKGSMSAYYNTPMRDVLVGTLFAFGIALFAYRGYDRTDAILASIAAVGALGTALFGTPAEGVDNPPMRIAHGVFTLIFYGSLILFSLWLFRKTDPDGTPTNMKQKRDQIYLVAGLVMVVSVVFIALTWLFGLNLLGGTAIFWFETVANTAFGVSWFVKGGLIPSLNDRHD